MMIFHLLATISTKERICSHILFNGNKDVVYVQLMKNKDYEEQKESFNQWFRLGKFSGTCGDMKLIILLKMIWASVIPILLCIFKILIDCSVFTYQKF